ncbi:pyridoxamine 5'-phosphate oxidase family protein [Fusobacterium varium]|uniref:pyridoxamine 5'-phosphate oxidase family protein n=1 Tax=Fusobacterium varium TaxID=856 RepID=UPI00356A16D8
MKEILDFLKNNPVQFFATIGLDGRPKVRPFQFMLEKNGKLFFCTSNQKEVWREIKNNPYVELCSSTPAAVWLRIHGKIVFDDNIITKSEIIENNPLVKSIYKTPDNLTFEIFYLEDAEAVFYDFSGNPPKKYSL